MKTIKGPGIFLAQFADDKSPFNSLDEIGPLSKWSDEPISYYDESEVSNAN